MDTIELLCVNNERSKTAEVLAKSDKYMKVALQGTQITIELSRQDLNKPYTGTTAGLEFSYDANR